MWYRFHGWNSNSKHFFRLRLLRVARIKFFRVFLYNLASVRNLISFHPISFHPLYSWRANSMPQLVIKNNKTAGNRQFTWTRFLFPESLNFRAALVQLSRIRERGTFSLNCFLPTQIVTAQIKSYFRSNYYIFHEIMFSTATIFSNYFKSTVSRFPSKQRIGNIRLSFTRWATFDINFKFIWKYIIVHWLFGCNLVGRFPRLLFWWSVNFISQLM